MGVRVKVVPVKDRHSDVRRNTMASVKVLITNKQKQVKLPSGLRLLVRRACTAVLAAEQFPGPAEVSVTFVDNEQIQELNAAYRNKDIPTDVLSFPLGKDGVYDKNMETGAFVLGDIVTMKR